MSAQVFTGAKHSTSEFEATIKEFARVGDLMNTNGTDSLRVALVSSRVDILPAEPFILRNYGHPDSLAIAQTVGETEIRGAPLNGSNAVTDWIAVGKHVK